MRNGKSSAAEAPDVRRVRGKSPLLEQYDLNPHSTADLFKSPPREPKFIVTDLIPDCTVGVLYGKSGCGKSTLSWELSGMIALGRGEFLGRKVSKTPRSVAVLLGENSQRDFFEVAQRQFPDEGAQMKLRRHWVLTDRTHPISISTDEGREWLDAIIEAHRPDVLVLDNLTSLVTDPLDSGEVATKVMVGLKRLTANYGTTVILVAHTKKERKNESDNLLESLSGSYALGAFADWAVLLKDSGGAVEDLRAVVTKSRRGADRQEVALIRDRSTLRHRPRVVAGRSITDGNGEEGPSAKITKDNLAPVVR